MAVTRSPVDVAILLDLLFALAFDIHPMAHFRIIGPLRPFIVICHRCGATRRTGRSLQVQNRADREFTQRGTN